MEKKCHQAAIAGNQSDLSGQAAAAGEKMGKKEALLPIAPN